MNTAINNLTIQNVLSIVESNSTFTPEEKETAMDTLTKITELVVLPVQLLAKWHCSYRCWLKYSSNANRLHSIFNRHTLCL